MNFFNKTLLVSACALSLSIAAGDNKKQESGYVESFGNSLFNSVNQQIEQGNQHAKELNQTAKRASDWPSIFGAGAGIIFLNHGTRYALNAIPGPGKAIPVAAGIAGGTVYGYTQFYNHRSDVLEKEGSSFQGDRIVSSDETGK